MRTNAIQNQVNRNRADAMRAVDGIAIGRIHTMGCAEPNRGTNRGSVVPAGAARPSGRGIVVSGVRRVQRIRRHDSVRSHHPSPPDECLPLGVLTGLEVECDPVEYRFVPILSDEAPIRQKEACCDVVTDPCGIDWEFCLEADFLHHVGKNHFRVGGYSEREVCVTSTVTVDLA